LPCELLLEVPLRRGQAFTFKGDDDEWAFIDAARAVVLGDSHFSPRRSTSMR